MKRKSWYGSLSTICLGLLLLVAGAAWALPGDLSGASNEALVSAIGGACETDSRCGQLDACINGGIPAFWAPNVSVYYIYNYTSNHNSEYSGAASGTCREQRYFPLPNCGGMSAGSWFWDLC